jgi:predicted HicB family RNase H-like nuclease
MKTKSQEVKEKQLGRPRVHETPQLRFELRFQDLEHRELCDKAAKQAGAVSLNAWVVPTLLAAARRELRAAGSAEAGACD